MIQTHGSAGLLFRRSQPAIPPRRGVVEPAPQRDILRAAEAARPIGDLPDSLIAEYPDADSEWVFAALKAIYAGGFAIDPARQRARI